MEQVTVTYSGAPARQLRSALNPLGPFRGLIRYRNLILRLVLRDLSARFKGSVLGAFWLIITPLITLAVYTFVFSVVFQARWGTADGSTQSRGEFALILFAGLLVFNVFSEMLNRAPTVVLEHASYVKRVVFPLEILSYVLLLTALFNFLVGLLLLSGCMWFLFGSVPVAALAVPVLCVPLFLFILGMGWFLAATGVYIRDLRPIVALAGTVIMFLSPIFYPLSAIPERFRTYILLNPLTTVVENVRGVLFSGANPDWQSWAIQLAVGIFVSWAGYVWFIKTRRGFADVL